MRKVSAAFLSFLLVFLFLMTSAGAAQEKESLFRDILLNVDYGSETTYVIGHKSPDSDTVGSAIAYAYLLNQTGIPAEAVISAPVNRETAYALKVFGMDPPPVLTRAEGKQFVLVDHSTYTQAIDGMADARIVGILDHHGIGNVINSEQIFVISAPVGATASLVYNAYCECNVEIPQNMARVMLMGLLSDTSNMTKTSVTLLDRKAFQALTDLAKLDSVDRLYQGMIDASINYDGMTNLEIYRSDYKEYEAGGTSFSIGVVKVNGEDEMLKMADRMKSAMKESQAETGMDMLFVMVTNKNESDSENHMCMTALGDGAEMLLQKIFLNDDGSGHFIFKEDCSRKKDIVPAITEALE